jgi:hypothetical protein
MMNDRNTCILLFQLNNGKRAYFTKIFMIPTNDHEPWPVIKLSLTGEHTQQHRDKHTHIHIDKLVYYAPAAYWGRAIIHRSHTSGVCAVPYQYDRPVITSFPASQPGNSIKELSQNELRAVTAREICICKSSFTSPFLQGDDNVTWHG